MFVVLLDQASVNCVVFQSNSMKLDEVLVHIGNYNFTNFHCIQIKD